MKKTKNMLRLFLILLFTSMSLISFAQKAKSIEEINKGINAAFASFYAQWNGKGKLAPDFVAYDVQGNPMKLSDYNGKKIVIIDFWYTTCHMCIKGMPMVHKIAEKYADQDVVVISACMPEKKEDFEKFVLANQTKYPKFNWVQDRTAEKMDEGVAMKQYGLIGAPSQIVIDKNGVVVGASNFAQELLGVMATAGIKIDPADVKASIEEKLHMSASMN